MVRLFIRHSVEEFTVWKHVYDEFDDLRREHGVMDEAVFRGVEDADDVTVQHDFESVEAARSFLEIPLLANVMSTAGVEGTPEIWLTTSD